MTDWALEFLLGAVRVLTSGTLALFVTLSFIGITHKLSARLHVWALRLCYIKLFILFITSMALPVPLVNFVDATIGCREVVDVVSTSSQFSLVAKAALFFWALVVFFKGVGLAQGFARIRRFHRKLVPLKESEFLSMVENVCHKMKTRVPRVYFCNESGSPLVFGVFRKNLVLPESIYNLEAERAKAVIFHEMSHIKNKDPEWTVFNIIFESLMFFHPLVWIAKKWRESLQEQMADETALNFSQGQAKQLAEAILYFTTFQKKVRATQNVFLMATSYRELSTRLKKIGAFRLRRPKTYVFENLLIFIAFMMLVLPWQMPEEAWSHTVTDKSGNFSFEGRPEKPNRSEVIKRKNKDEKYIEGLLRTLFKDSRKEKC